MSAASGAGASPRLGMASFSSATAASARGGGSGGGGASLRALNVALPGSPSLPHARSHAHAAASSSTPPAGGHGRAASAPVGGAGAAPESPPASPATPTSAAVAIASGDAHGAVIRGRLAPTQLPKVRRTRLRGHVILVNVSCFMQHNRRAWGYLSLYSAGRYSGSVRPSRVGLHCSSVSLALTTCLFITT